MSLTRNRGTSGRPYWLSATQRLLVTLCVPVLVLLTGCGSDPVALPDVVGIRLDEAHRALEGKGFKKFDDRDRFGDRGIFVDSNWVVLEQEPAAESRGDVDAVVTLLVGKIGEVRTKKALPADSPVLKEMLAAEEEKRREDAAKAKKESEAAAESAKRKAAEDARKAKERKSAAVEYVNAIDPAARLAVKNHTELAKLGRQASGGMSGDELTENVAGASQALTTLTTILGSLEPSGEALLDREHEQLLKAVASFKQAALTLLSADGASRKSSVARFNTVYAQARADWNAALTASYSAGQVPSPPLIP